MKVNGTTIIILAAVGVGGFLVYKKLKAPAPAQQTSGGGFLADLGQLAGGLMKGWGAPSSGSQSDPARTSTASYTSTSTPIFRSTYY